MADQKFLASFAVEIDEQGVSRLQAALEENRNLANEAAAALSTLDGRENPLYTRLEFDGKGALWMRKAMMATVNRAKNIRTGFVSDHPKSRPE